MATAKKRRGERRRVGEEATIGGKGDEREGERHRLRGREGDTDRGRETHTQREKGLYVYVHIIYINVYRCIHRRRERQRGR